MYKRLYFACLLASLIMTQCQPKVYSRPQSLTIEEIHKCITIEGQAGVSLHGLVDSWYNKSLKEGKSKSEAANIATVKLMEAIDDMVQQEMKLTEENARKI
jgi:hypothetical protein